MRSTSSAARSFRTTSACASNVLEDFRTYRRSIDELTWPVDDKFRVHGGVGAFTAVPNVQRTFSLDANGEMKLRNDLNMEKYLDANFLKYPGNEAHLVIDGVLFVLEDTDDDRCQGRGPHFEECPNGQNFEDGF